MVAEASVDASHIKQWSPSMSLIDETDLVKESTDSDFMADMTRNEKDEK